MVRHGTHDQIFQALSLFFYRGGAWIRGYKISDFVVSARIRDTDPRKPEDYETEIAREWIGAN